MTRVLVTGANGHLGVNIIRSLLKRDYDVVPFVRTTSDLRGLDPLNLTYAYGDVMDRDSLSAAALIAEAAVLTPEQRRKYAEVAPMVHSNPRRAPPRRQGPPPR